MKRLNSLEYLKLSKPQAFWYDLKLFFSKIPAWFKGLFVKLWLTIKNFFLGIKDGAVDIFNTFKKGNWAVKLSFISFGAGNIYYGQIMRGLLFLLFEIIFVVYTFVLPTGGLYWMKKVNWFIKGSTVGTIQGGNVYNPVYDVTTWQSGDDSVRVLLYGLLSLFFVIAFFVVWRMQIKQCRINMELEEEGRKIKHAKDDLRSLIDEQFHKTLLTPSLIGILAFTVLPIIYMIIIAFTNYDAAHDGHANLFTWVGFDNFNSMTDFGQGGLGLALGEMVGWTLMWAFFATFTNYFAGLFVAILINKKGIRFKKLWRTVLVMTIAVPQFVSLMYVSKMFSVQGFVGSFLESANLIPEVMLKQNQFSLWDNPVSAKILLIVINLWVGVPYMMLSATGILMNIPADLYESSRVDGANAVQQFTKITLPYMLFVTGPYLITQFIGNINNFNVIFLLSGGGPGDLMLYTDGAKGTDLLITWLYKLSLGADRNYKLASVIGILVFVISATFSLIVYNKSSAVKGEDNFQ